MVARAADAVPVRSEAGPLARLADRWIYVFMAGLFVATALTGFIPRSLIKLAAVDAGQRAPFPPVLHVHAMLMGSWLLLLLAQTSLVATGRTALHRRLGVIALVLVPSMVAAMIGITMSAWSSIASIPAGLMPPEALSQTKTVVTNVLLQQIHIVVLFPALVGWAVLVRKKDSETHKRLLILATVLPLAAGIDRLTWLPTTSPDSPVALYLYQLAWLLPVLIYDVLRRGRVHRAYVIGIAANSPFVLATLELWGSPWWFATAPRLMGVQSW